MNQIEIFLPLVVSITGSLLVLMLGRYFLRQSREKFTLGQRQLIEAIDLLREHNSNLVSDKADVDADGLSEKRRAE